MNKYRNIKNLFFPSTARKLRLYYGKHYESRQIQEDVILYETRDGNSIVDSPYEMFLYLARTPEYSHYKHLWVVSERNKGIEESIPENLKKKVKFVYRNTQEYIDGMLEAKYLISNSTFESFFVKRPGQIYINTWHGTPIKKMGFDVPGALSNSQNVMRNFLMTDYLLSPNKHTSEIFMHSYKLLGAFSGEILEGGYPRIDATIHLSKETVVGMLAKLGMTIDQEKPIILFSPTWKGSDSTNVNDDIEQLILEIEKIISQVGGNYQVLMKVHPFAYEKICTDPRVREYLVSDFMNANALLAITDILITDYSSIFFDYLVTKRPVVFYAWDKDLYSNERGLYLDIEELPGPTAENVDELITLIKDIDNQHRIYAEKYAALAKKMVCYDDGNVTEKYIDYIFKGKESPMLTLYKSLAKKTKLLIYPGGMLSNGITSSFINLMNNIDYEKYDVSVLLNQDNRLEVQRNLEKLPKHVRPLYRFGLDILTTGEKLTDRKIVNEGLTKNNGTNYPEIGYQREMNRIVANMAFDVSIDFSGYSYFWGRHILATKADKKIVFIHSNIKADSMREVNGKYPMLKGLTSLFSIYSKFDKILSVSPMTRDVNFENLQEYVREEQMSFVYNTINIDEILDKQIVVEKKAEPLKVSKKLLTVNQTSDVKMYKNIDGIIQNQFKEITLVIQNEAVQHATFQTENDLYLKVSINNEYVGWISEIYFSEREVEIYEIEDYHGFGTVARAFHYPILREINLLSDEQDILTSIRPFKQRYMEFMKIAYTTRGKYLYVKYLDQELGWVLATPLMRLHELKKYSLGSMYFRYKMKQQDRKDPVVYSSKVTLVEKYAQLIESSATKSLWTAPKGMTGATEILIPDEYFRAIFKVTELVTLGEEIYARLALDNGEFIGYVNTNSLEYVAEAVYLPQLKTAIADESLPKLDLAKYPVPDFDENIMNFVHMGRLSPEKNQAALISAFGKFNQEYSNSRLYILGKGPLEEDLVNLVQELQLEGKVVLLGHIHSPYTFMKKSEYFVLPSLYEGQPMVLLEALTLGMKVLASNIPANESVIEEDGKYGMMTDGITVEDIYQGFIRVSQYQGDFTPFDYQKYNQLAIESFYHEIS